MNFRTSIAALIATAAMFFAPLASALGVCVSTTQGLRDQLNAWQVLSDQTLTIKLVQGTYAYTYNDYWSQPYYGGNAKLQLLGGYTAGCASRSVVPTNTVLTGNSVQFSTFQLFGSSSMLIEGITFKSFDREVSFDGDSSDPGDSTVVRYVIGTDLFGASSSQVSFGGFRVIGNSNMRVESSLFYNIHGGDTASALEVFGFTDNAIGIVTNVTAAYNGARGMQLGCFQCSGSVLAYNNILYNNTAGDLDTRYSEAGSSVSMLFSDINPSKVALGPGSYSPIGNINADPKFENPLNNDFVLLNASPAINTGAPENIVPGGYASQDVGGGVRILGSHVDMGAYESIVNDLASQSVTSAADNAFDPTLRTAITTANQNANATTINFNITGGCPQVIYLSTPLPDITSDVTINGFSEPGSKVNTQYTGYDGQICVIVRASNSSVAHALKVSGAGRLTLKGIEFEGFSTAAVRLAAGNGSIVTGNGFAANPGSTANDAGVRIEGTANNSLIGGLSPNNRNVFDQGSTGVDFESNGTGRSNVVEGNYFGFNFDGTPWTGPVMTYGIYLLASGGNTIGYNSIGKMNSNGIRLSGTNSTANTMIGNGIGIAPTGVAAGNGNAGIGIAAGAHDNVVGTDAAKTPQGSGGGNYIVNNFGPGVWIESTAGAANRVDGNNVIHDNSGFLPVDLGAAGDTFGLGPTGNDADDVDTGPNNLQNYPTLTQAKRIEADTIVVSGYVLPQASGGTQNYRIDLFWTDSCTGTGVDTPRGEMKRYVGFFSLAVATNSHFVPWSNLPITAPANIPGNGYLFATETSASGNTSEPGKCFPFTDDYIFSDSFGS